TALFQKGRDYRREIEESRDGWSFDLVQHASVVDVESVVLQISNVRRNQAAK
ncbi:MAG: 16S rRNA (guanine(527)-N(7))-methyltransferase RsmG, partial [Phyllobacterium sp.]|nr:16S rRNA (guanine(527)-N(7))-methyltransferase RsmG [Phyllobacterium sp.]